MFMRNIRGSLIIATSMLYICAILRLCATPVVAGLRNYLVHVLVGACGGYGASILLRVIHWGFNWGFYTMFATLMMYDRARLKNSYPYQIISHQTLLYVFAYTLGDAFITGYAPVSVMHMLENIFCIFIIMIFIEFLFTRYKTYLHFDYSSLLEKEYIFYMVAVGCVQFINNMFLYAAAITIVTVFFSSSVSQLKNLMQTVESRSVPLYLFLSILTVYKYMILLLIILGKKI